MAQQDSQRETLFYKFSTQLHYLKAKGFLPDHLELRYSHTYLCPICTRSFSSDDLKENAPNRLTLEDAPPHSLGGKKIALTCQKCNNTCGYTIDKHLSLGMNDLDKKSFLPGAEIDLKFIRDGITVNGEIMVGNKGTAKVTHVTERNNPKLLNEYISGLKPDLKNPIQFEFRKSLLDQRKLGLALLKTGYILTFAKFGYTFLMDRCYDRIREQLLNPDKLIYPVNFWTSKPFAPEHEGVHLLLNDQSEGFFSVFPLTTKFETRRFGVYIQPPGYILENVLQVLNRGSGLELRLDRALGNFIDDQRKIREIESWNRALIVDTIGLFLN